jgi:hypothetical protein
LNRDPLDFVKRDLIRGPVVEFGGAGRLVRRDLLGVLQRAVLQAGGDAGGAEGVAADLALRHVWGHSLAYNIE